jgi:hypothetical protein
VRIEQLQREIRDGWARVSAQVVWEDAGRDPRSLAFEVPERFAGDLALDPNAFALAAALPAVRHRERRLAIEGPLCPRLAAGLETAVALLRTWHGGARALPRLEPSRGFAPAWPRAPQRTAALLSGGVDSLALLRGNRLDFAPDHPCAVRDAIVVSYGFEGPRYDHAVFQEHLERLDPLAREADVELVPIRSSAGLLDTDAVFWTDEQHAPALMAAALVLCGRFSDLLVASSVRYDLLHRVFTGSHPLLDVHYASAALRVHHEDVRLSRLEKVARLAEWEPALACLRVCVDPRYPRGAANCGRCEKCIRTMTELLAVGALARCPTFPETEVTPEQLDAVELRHEYELHWYRDLVEPLRTRGRGDLARVLEAKVAAFGRRPGTPPRPAPRWRRPWAGR